MATNLIHIDPDSTESLQSQIRNKLVEGILVGSFPPNTKLPSSRKLAKQLNVSRNTIVLVYQALMDEGYIITKQRSGIFVSEHINTGRVKNLPSSSNHSLITPDKTTNNIQYRFKGAIAKTYEVACPYNWRRYAYPFIDGKFDASLYPIKEWREANNRANASGEIYQWSGLQGLQDDPMLLDEIRSKILPRRGIQASQDEILITVGTQQALHLITQLFVDSSVNVAVEEPGYPEMRELLLQQGANLVYQPLDDQGLVINNKLDDCDIIYTTPSHQTPTSITMSMARRDQLLQQAKQHNSLIIEDDFEFESNFLGQPHPALRSLDKNNRVVYVSCLSKVLAAGVQIAFIVADKQVIQALKKIRKMIMRHPPIMNQRAVAYFLSLGYYDSFMMQLHKVFFERWLELREALNIYLPNCIDTGPIQGGTAYWITGPSRLDGEYLREKAAEQGILIEPIKRYFASSEHPANCFRMGITSLPSDKIRAGVKKLADLIHQLTAEFEEKLSNAKGSLLTGDALTNMLTGAVLECQMVYGVECIIELLNNGTMRGRTGGKDSEIDSGRWWIENDIYYRQWNLWGYGEVKGFYIIMDGQQMKWFDLNYCLVRQLKCLEKPSHGKNS
ncbi:PLP-dependent aminotransferase family protein [Pseudoalteromonas sp. MB41]|uniref:MocR-like pyridoxine biosynthesis transcription factor PdxR n=1 Tax=Pseudoalteromonas sp. MB41 TaxID=2896366 RepID=UPI001E337DEB|nr:PLP-dependent aminotransferase family protein [Pseudoalteromonas sp. MB41]MCC9662092.1 PLP-dependent aminotransferase family protein [Pseudoalteromonas sp. MB41]